MKTRGYLLCYIKEYERNIVKLETDKEAFVGYKKILTREEQGISVMMQCPELFMYGYGVG